MKGVLRANDHFGRVVSVSLRHFYAAYTLEDASILHVVYKGGRTVDVQNDEYVNTQLNNLLASQVVLRAHDLNGHFVSVCLRHFLGAFPMGEEAQTLRLLFTGGRAVDVMNDSYVVAQLNNLMPSGQSQSYQ